jgi:2-hydroxychromene-2-carboxylate isomerase
VLAATEGWIAGYAQATCRRWFQEGLEQGSEPNLFESLREIGPSRVTALAATPDIGTAYEAAIGRARDLGIFGSPTFRVGHELFWSDERLNDAIAWYRRSTLAGA